MSAMRYDVQKSFDGKGCNGEPSCSSGNWGSVVIG